MSLIAKNENKRQLGQAWNYKALLSSSIITYVCRVESSWLGLTLDQASAIVEIIPNQFTRWG